MKTIIGRMIAFSMCALMMFASSTVNASQAVTKQSLVNWMVKESGHKVEPTLANTIAQEVIKQSHIQNVDPFLILSLIKHESSFRPSAKSAYGAMGLMQVVPRWHKDKIKNRNITNIATNIEVGVQILKKCISDKNGSMRAGLRCYSGGAVAYRSKLHASYEQIKRYDVAFRFTNELPITVVSSFDKPHGFEHAYVDTTAIAELDRKWIN